MFLNGRSEERADQKLFEQAMGAGGDPSKGPYAVARRAAALSMAVSRAPLSWGGEELFALADKFVEYINGERAEEAKPAAAEFSGFGPTVAARKDSAGRIFVWDEYACTHREVVYK